MRPATPLETASMRPRRFCRGKPAAWKLTPGRPGRFNEAPAILLGKAPAPSVGAVGFPVLQ